MARDSDPGRRTLFWLCGINAAVFILLKLLGIEGHASWLAVALPSSFQGWLARPWTLLTYMVAHTDFLHLLFNVLWLFWFGMMLLATIDRMRLLTLYIGGGLGGGICYLFAGTAAHPGVLLGASASVLAMMAATGILLPNLRLHIFFIGDVKMKWVVIFMVWLAFLGAGGGTAGAGGFAAHAGGILFGVVAGLYMRRKGEECRRKEHRRVPTPAGARRVASIMEQNRLDKIRLDELLDKIKVSGYESLSRSERRELDEISKRISK